MAKSVFSFTVKVVSEIMSQSGGCLTDASIDVIASGGKLDLAFLR